jgi:hypothetical protein
MTSSDDHINNMTDAYNRYRERQRTVEEHEKKVETRYPTNRILRAHMLSKNKLYPLDAGSRNANQEQVRTEALVAITGLLWDIREILRRIEGNR